MNILVTGSTGVLGSRLYNLISNLKTYKLFRFRGDLTNFSQVKKNFSDNHSYDIIIHLAALVPIKEVNNEPGKAYAVNVGGTINLLRATFEFNQRPFFLFASSSHVYSPKNSPLKEIDKLKPISIYGETKMHAESIISSFCNKIKIDYCIARIFSFYDKNQKPPFLYANIKQRIEEEDLTKPFFISGGNSKRDFLTAKQVSKIIFKLVQHKKTGIYNIGSGVGKTVKDFVQELSSVNLNIKTDEKFDALIADISKIKNILE